MTTRNSQRPAIRSMVRTACDRCHETKSRCARATGCLKCERCTRLGNVCIYSAPLPMGRPKEKDMTSNASCKGCKGGCTHDSRGKRKRHDQAAQRTDDTMQLEYDNENITSPCSSTPSITNVRPVVQIEDSTSSISESWINTAWPSGGFDLDYMMQSAVSCNSPSDNSISIPSNTFDQFHDTSFATLLPPATTTNTSASRTWGAPSNQINSRGNLSGDTRGEQSGDPVDTYDGCLHQLLKLQLDLYQISSDASEPASCSRPLPEIHFPTTGGSPCLRKSGMSSLDMILGTTQTLIDILRASFSKSAPELQLHDYPALTPQGDRPAYSQSTYVSTEAINGNSDHNPDTVTTLLILACYSSLLVAYDRLIDSLILSPSNSSDKMTTALPNLSPSLNFGTFSMTAKSTLYVSTLLHVVKQMLEQLQATFKASFPSSSKAQSEAAPLDEDVYSVGQNAERSNASEIGSPIVSAAQTVLVDIAKKEKRLMDVLATK